MSASSLIVHLLPFVFVGTPPLFLDLRVELSPTGGASTLIPVVGEGGGLRESLLGAVQTEGTVGFRIEV
jgi:hypothetical protein